jgi:hypothetical protein
MGVQLFTAEFMTEATLADLRAVKLEADMNSTAAGAMEVEASTADVGKPPLEIHHGWRPKRLLAVFLCPPRVLPAVPAQRILARMSLSRPPQ